MKGKLTVALILALFIIMTMTGIGYCGNNPDDEDGPDDEPIKKPPFRHYFPRDPAIKKLHLEALSLALENAELVKERSARQVENASLEMEESRLKFELLKNRILFYRYRDRAESLALKKPFLKKIFIEQDKALKIIDGLVEKEEKIDCYHTIFERKHKATEEYQWSLLDDKHSLISEYLEGMDSGKDRLQFETLYGEIIADYREIIQKNRMMLEESKKIIEAKKTRLALMKEANDRMKGLTEQLEKILDEQQHL